MNLSHPSTAVVLSLVLSLLIPLVSAALSREHYPKEVTGLLSAAVAAVNGFFTQWSQSPNLSHYNWSSAALLSLYSLAVATLVGWLGIWQGSSTAQKLLGLNLLKFLQRPVPPAVTSPPVPSSPPVVAPPSGVPPPPPAS